MKKLSSKTGVFAKLDQFDKTTFAFATPGILSRKRVSHLADEVIPRMIRVRPVNMYQGELEVILLSTLRSLADKILANDGVSPGFVANTFLERSEIFSVISEVSNMAGSKIVADALSSELFAASPIGQVMISGATDLTVASLLSALDEKKSNTSLKKAYATLKETPISPEASEEIFNSLMRVGGQGKGVPLIPSKRVNAYDVFAAIELAISMLRDPSLLTSKNNAPVFTAEELSADAYAFAMAYVVYLHHSSSPEQYDAIFPPASRMTPSINRLAQVQSAARRAAWFYSGLANAAEVSDAHYVVWLISNGLSFLKPLEDNTSFHADAQATLNAAKATLSESSVAPVQYHTQVLINAISRVSGSDQLLPAFMGKLVKVSSATPRKDPSIPKGWNGFSPNSFSRTIVSSSTAEHAFTYMYDIVRSLRTMADVLTHRMNSFLSATTEYDPNALNIPNELFAIEADIVTASEPTYSSIVKREFLPLSIPRYKVSAAAPRKPTWHLEEYQFSAVDLLALRAKLVASSTGRFTFSPDIVLPLKNSLLDRIFDLPLPYDYVNYAHYQSISNRMDDVSSLLKGTDNGLFKGSDFLDDIVVMMSMSNASNRAHLATSLAGLFTVFVKPEGSSEFEVITPGCPTIYGVFTRSFIAGQTPLSKMDENPQLFTEVQAQTGDTFLFRLHNRMPDPAKCVFINAQVDLGVYISVPLIWSQFVMVAKTVLTNSARGSEFKYNPQSLLAEAEASESKLTEAFKKNSFEVSGWATITQPLPHLLFDYQPMMSEEFPTIDNDFNSMIQLQLVRRVSPSTRSMTVQSTVAESIVVIEPSDLEALAASEDYATPEKLEVALADAQATDDKSKSPKTPSIEVNTSVSPTSLPGDNAEELVNSVRDITTTTIPSGAVTGDEAKDKARSTNTATQSDSMERLKKATKDKTPSEPNKPGSSIVGAPGEEDPNA